jgi:hypothetical protein
LDGIDDRIFAPLPTGISYADPFSLSFWARRTDGATTLKAFVALQGADTNDEQIALAYWYGTYNGLFIGRKWTSALGAQPASALTISNLNHYCITNVGGDARCTIYVNGVMNSTSRNDFLSRSAANTLTFGGALSSYSQTDMADLMVHKGVLPGGLILQLADPAWSIDYGGLILPVWQRVFAAAVVGGTATGVGRIIGGSFGYVLGG